MKNSIFVLCTFILMACGKSESTQSGQGSGGASPDSIQATESYSYQFIYNRCDTGRHVFNTIEEYCTGLENESLNQNCALPLRRARHESVCKQFGDFRPFTTKIDSDEVQVDESEAVVQLTALHFLTGGFEQCRDVKNKLFFIKLNSKNLKQTICKNSKVELYFDLVGDELRFHTVDLATGQEYFPEKGGESSLKLNKGHVSLRYYPVQPYGFTYVIAEEVTGIDTDLLNKWNTLNSRLSKLKEQVILAKQNGTAVPEETLEKMKAIESEMETIAAQMEASRK